MTRQGKKLGKIGELKYLRKKEEIDEMKKKNERRKQ